MLAHPAASQDPPVPGAAARQCRAVRTRTRPGAAHGSDTPDRPGWLDLARARSMRYVARVVLDLDAEANVVRVTEQMTRFDGSAGLGGASVEWRTLRGVTFFQVERGRV